MSADIEMDDGAMLVQVTLVLAACYDELKKSYRRHAHSLDQHELTILDLKMQYEDKLALLKSENQSLRMKIEQLETAGQAWMAGEE